MQQGLLRTLIIYGVLIVAAIYIYPTIGWMTLSDESRQARLERWKEEDSERALDEPHFWRDTWRGIRRWAEFDRDWVINLGLDLQGGIHMVIGFDPPPNMEERELTMAEIQELVLQRVQNRVYEFEAQEPIIQKLGTNQIQIQLPGEKDIQRARNLIMRTAYLTFHMVAGPDETNQVFRAIDAHFNNQFVPFIELPFARGGAYQVSVENYERVKAMVDEALKVPGLVPEDKTIAFSAPPKPKETRGFLIYLMDKEPAITGEGLETAVARPDPQSPGAWQILFKWDAPSANRFAQLTEDNIGRNMAIVLDGHVVSAPNILSRIYMEGNITGGFSQQEAKDLAITLNSGSMPVPVREDYTGVIGASLGADSVEKGVRSAVLSLIIVMGFMIIYYRRAGVIANLALLSNALCVVGALAYFNSTLTLPGIAGLILTIGMAVDANVLIFERIREELRNGKSLASSVEGGFARATSAILDSNVTTLIAAAVLSQFGTGPVQGFAVTLSIGVCASVFAALVVSRAIFDFALDHKLLGRLAMMSFLKGEPRINFLGKWPIAVTVSVIIVAAGVVTIGMRGSSMLGVDFTNGTNMIVALDAAQPVPVGQLRQQLAQVGFVSPVVQEYQEGEEGGINQFNIRVPVVSQPPAEGAAPEEAPESVSVRVQRALLPLTDNPQSGDLGAKVQLVRVETVGPAVGARLQRDALSAIFYSLFFILAYLWFRFELRYAVGAIVALLHDVLITVGIFAFTGREIDIPVVAAILTVIGYSLNDTIIVFDRVREDWRAQRGRGLSLFEVMNLSVNRTLSRTILTSGTTLFVVIVLYFFGGVAINDFAFALAVGIIVGTFSSIYVASPSVLLYQRVVERWRERRGATTGRPAKGDEEKAPKKSKKRREQKPGEAPV